VKHFKILGLATMAFMSFLVFDCINSLFAGDYEPFIPARALGVLYISCSTLGATALRLGKSRQYGQSRLITHCPTTAITTNGRATCTVTIDPFVQRLSKLQKERYAPLHISVMAC
jgi:hypothetical protein